MKTTSARSGERFDCTQEDADAYIARSRHEPSVQPIRQVEIGSGLLWHVIKRGKPSLIPGQDVVPVILR